MDWRSRIRESIDGAGAVVDEDVIQELATHAASLYQELRADGCDATEAERQVGALIDSWRTQAPNLHRGSSRQAVVEAPPLGSRGFAGLTNDLRYTLRGLSRNRSFAGLAILTMTLGIGLVTILFSVVYAVFWKPLPWPEPERLIRLTETHEGATKPHPLQMGNGAYLAWQDNPATIETLGGFWTSTATISGIGAASRDGIGHVTASIFSLVHAKPFLGSLFTPDEEEDLGKVILSFGIWQERFGGRPEAIGKALQIDGSPFTIIGIMPREFVFPDRSARAWIPYHVRPVVSPGGRGTSTQIFGAMARLRPGATVEQAAAEATARARSAPDGGLAMMAFWGAAPKARVDISAAPALDALTAEVRPALIAVIAAVVLLFAAVIGNVASLQLARTLARQREIAIRCSIGAGAGRLTRQFLTESIVLGLAGGTAGLLLAAGLHRALPSVLPADFPRLGDVSFDLRVALFAGSLTLLAGLIVGMLPALQVWRVNLAESLTEDHNGSIGGRRQRLPLARTAIMIGQISIACILLVGASLLSRSFIAMMHADRGYDAASLMTATIPMPAPAFPPQRQVEALDRIMERVRALPSVVHAAYADSLPLSSSETLSAFVMPSNRPPVGTAIQVHSVRHVVSEDYFQTFGMRILKGRAFSPADSGSSANVVVVNRAFARLYLSDSGIGDRIVNFADTASNAKGEYEVIGIIDDVVEHNLSDPIQPEIYSLQRQTTFRSSSPGLVIRTQADPRAMIASLRSIVNEENSSLVLASVMTMEERLSSSLSRPRFYAVLLAIFALSALLITAVGLFGVLSYSVSQRNREFALRTALGAAPADLVRLVLKQGLMMTISGLLAGSWISFVLVKYLSSLLYGVQTRDWISFAGVSVMITAISVLACLAPAVRALKIDPIRALGTH